MFSYKVKKENAEYNIIGKAFSQVSNKLFHKNILLIALLCLICFTACKEDDRNLPEPPDTTEYEMPEIKGWGWKLIRMEVITDYDFENREIIDYSKYNIVYDFEFEKDYEKVDYHWTPPFKLTIHNYLPSAFYPDDIERGGEHIYQYMGYDHNYNLKIGDKAFACVNAAFVNISNPDPYAHPYIYETTDSIAIGFGKHILYDDNYTVGWKSWTKYFIKIREGGNQ